MTEPIEIFLREMAVRAGARRDFLAECGVTAHLGPSGAHLSATAIKRGVRRRAPERTHDGQERELAEIQRKVALRSRAPGHSPQENECDWNAEAKRVIDALPDEALRPALFDLYEEAAAFIEFEQNRPRQEAEESAFGLLLFHVIRHGHEPRGVT